MLQMWKVLERCILTYNKHLLTDVNKYQCLTNDIVYETDKQNSNRPMWQAIDGSKLTNDWWETLSLSANTVKATLTNHF